MWFLGPGAQYIAELHLSHHLGMASDTKTSCVSPSHITSLLTLIFLRLDGGASVALRVFCRFVDRRIAMTRIPQEKI